MVSLDLGGHTLQYCLISDNGRAFSGFLILIEIDEVPLGLGCEV